MFDEDSPLTGPATRVKSTSQSWGISALAIGCTLLLSSCTLMIFNLLLFNQGPLGIPITLARIVGMIAVIGISLLGLASVTFGIRSWRDSASNGDSVGFGVAGTLTSFVGLVAWLIAGGDMLIILGWFS